MKIDVNVAGIDKVLKMLNKRLGEETVKDIDNITEAYTRKMAGEAAEHAPVKSGDLKGSITESPKPSSEPHYWEYGSALEYAVIQEYTHKTRKAFIRRSIWDNEDAYKQAVFTRVKKG